MRQQAVVMLKARVESAAVNTALRRAKSRLDNSSNKWQRSLSKRFNLSVQINTINKRKQVSV